MKKAKPLIGEKLAEVLELFKVRQPESYRPLSTSEIAQQAGLPHDVVAELRKSLQKGGSTL